MERTHHKIDLIKSIVCSYYNVDEKLIATTSRKTPIPFIKKVICFMSQKHISITQQTLANYLNYKNHSIVSTAIRTLIDKMDISNTLTTEMLDLNRIIIQKGLSKLSGKNNEWYMFLDLNNFIIATKGESSVLWSKTDIDSIKKILGDGWEYTEHLSTNKFLYKRLKTK
jgi:hypothetical protein